MPGSSNERVIGTRIRVPGGRVPTSSIRLYSVPLALRTTTSVISMALRADSPLTADVVIVNVSLGAGVWGDTDTPET